MSPDKLTPEETKKIEQRLSEIDAELKMLGIVEDALNSLEDAPSNDPALNEDIIKSDLQINNLNYNTES